MAALSKAAKGLLAIRTHARDARWRASAQADCDKALLDARFADAEALAGAVGPTLRRQQDLARLGLGLPLAADAHPEAQRAARALAGPDPALVAGMKLSDPRRRALELHWELQAGQFDLARARAPRRLPTGEHRMWWAGVIELLAGEEDAASYSLMDAPGEGGRWAIDLRGWDEPSRPAGR